MNFYFFLHLIQYDLPRYPYQRLLHKFLSHILHRHESSVQVIDLALSPALHVLLYTHIN